MIISPKYQDCDADLGSSNYSFISFCSRIDLGSSDDQMSDIDESEFDQASIEMEEGYYKFDF